MTSMVSTPKFSPPVHAFNAHKLVRALWLSFGLCLLGTCEVQAVTLSRPQVQSIVGVPLKVEIDLSKISEEESLDLQVTLADQDTYNARGISMSTAIEEAKLELLTRDDNSKYLKITGVYPVFDPYVEVIVNLKWATGSILRNFGLLLATESTTPESKPLQTPVAVSSKLVHVESGDTAGKIALQNMDKNQLSLDQMLIALLNSNPDAFIQKNVNLVKAGAKLIIPSTDEALAVNNQAAHSEILLQSKAFGKYKTSLATNLPLSEMPKTEKSVSGKVSGKVKDSTPTPNDQLKLSSPEIKTDHSELPAEEKIAQQKQNQVNEERRQDLVKSIEDLTKLAQTTGLEVKSGFLSGLPNLLKINSLDDLSAWVNSNFELVYVSGFILGCIFLLWIWIRINKEPKSEAQTPSTTDEQHRAPKYVEVPDEISNSPVFNPLSGMHVQDLTEETAELFKNSAVSEPLVHTQDTLVAQPIKFDFDLNISSDQSSQAFTRSPDSPVLTPTHSEVQTLGSAGPVADERATNTPTANTQATRNLPLHGERPSEKTKSTRADLDNTNEQEDPFRVRLDLAEELWKLGQKHTGRALAQEVAEQAGEQMQQLAKRWLSEHP